MFLVKKCGSSLIKFYYRYIFLSDIHARVSIKLLELNLKTILSNYFILVYIKRYRRGARAVMERIANPSTGNTVAWVRFPVPPP